MFRRRRDEGGDHRWSQIVRNWQEVVTRGTVPMPPRTLFASFVSRAVYASISLLRIDFEIDPGKYPIPSPRPIQYLRQCAEKNIHAALLVHRCRSFGQRTNPDSRFISLTMYRISNPIFYPVERGIVHCDFSTYSFGYFRRYYFSIGKKKKKKKEIQLEIDLAL